MTKTYTTIKQVQEGVARIVERMREKGLDDPECYFEVHDTGDFWLMCGWNGDDICPFSGPPADAFREAHIWVGNLPDRKEQENG